MKKNKGFTLIELLVVISIIALLLAILMPTLSKAKEQARRVICQSNLGQISLMMFMYAHDNREKLPVTDYGAGGLDNVPYNVAEMVRKSYGIKPLYCPSNSRKANFTLEERYLSLMKKESGARARSFEEIASGIMVSDYFWLMEFGIFWRDPDHSSAPDWVYPSGSRFANKRYFTSRLDVRTPAMVSLVTDGTLSEEAPTGGQTIEDIDFSAINLPDGQEYVTNHLRETRVLGGNVLYADGHVEWVRPKEMSLNVDDMPGFYQWW